MSAGLSQSESLFEFGANAAPWSVVNDGVMGGVSSSTVRIADGVLEFSGQVRLENNGGFASVRSHSVQFNLSGFTGLRVRVRGDGKRYGFQLGTGTAQRVLYRSYFDTVPGEWLELEIPLAGLRPTRFGNTLSGPPLDGASVDQMGFIIANKRAETFRLQVDWIRASKR